MQVGKGPHLAIALFHETVNSALRLDSTGRILARILHGQIVRRNNLKGELIFQESWPKEGTHVPENQIFGRF